MSLYTLKTNPIRPSTGPLSKMVGSQSLSNIAQLKGGQMSLAEVQGVVGESIVGLQDQVNAINGLLKLSGSARVDGSALPFTPPGGTIGQSQFNGGDGRFRGSSPLLSSAFAFTAQRPGVSLTAATPATITLVPVPAGVNGADTNHYLYISGGTGTAEAVLITGGTAVSGAASGTITFTPANSHSGSWTLESATTGLQEAIWSTQGFGRVIMPTGTLTLYAPVTVPGDYNVSLRGMGQGHTDIKTSGALTGNWIFFAAGSQVYIDLGDFSIIDNTATSHTSGAMIYIKGKAYGTVNNIDIENAYDGLILDSCPGSVNYNALHIGCTRHAIQITTQGVNYPTAPQSGGAFSNCFLANATDSCIQIEGPTTSMFFSNVAALSATPSSTNYCVQYVMSSDNPAGEVIFVNCIFDAAGNSVRLVGDSTAYVDNWVIFTGCEANATEAALYIDGMVQNVYWNGGLIKASGGTLNYPVYIVGGSSTTCPRNIQLRNVSMYGTGAAALSVNHCIKLTISGVVVGNESGNTITTFMAITGSVSAFIENCDFTNCTTAKISQSGGASFANIRVVDFSNAFVFADLQGFLNGSAIMVNDGTIANPVAGGGTGCFAKRLNGVWVGN